MQIGVLGPLEVRDDRGVSVSVGGDLVRSLLAVLALAAGRPVSVPALLETLWAERGPSEQHNALQTLVSRLRRALGDPAIVAQSAAGYRLAVEPDCVDALHFERLLAERRPESALALWRGPALVDVSDSRGSLAAAAARLAALRVTATLELLAAQVEHGVAGVVGRLEGLSAEHPLDERVAALLMRALAADGRQADALAVFDRVRDRLADDLGVDPGPQLRDAHLAVLRGQSQPASTGPRSNLKSQLTSFVGRADEVVGIGKALEQSRLVTLVGPGGAGKTRLAAEAAGAARERLDGGILADGVWLVELASVCAAPDVAQAVLSTLGLRDTHVLDRRATPPAQDPTRRLLDSLADKRLLLVLDNCEHVVDAAAQLTDVLLAGCPGLRVLTTSREPLAIVGETLLAVPPLDHPVSAMTPAEAMTYPAVRLFADRALAVRPDFAFDENSAPPVIEIVRRLDGLPLAIELAAARLRTLPLEQVAERLSDRFRLLTGGSRTALPRHRTLRAVVEWSWDLLSADERVLLEQLAVFPAGVTADSAAAVSDGEVIEVAELIASLIDKSLLQPVGSGARARMLETIREYGIERLDERGALTDARDRHAAHFATLLATAEPHLIQADQLPWFALLTDERDNLLAAMRHLRTTGRIDEALRMALGLGTCAMLLGEHAEVASWLGDVLEPHDVDGGAAEPDGPPGDADLRLLVRALLALNASANESPTEASATVGWSALPDIARQLADVDVTLSPFAGLLRAGVAFFAGEHELARAYIDSLVRSDDTWSRAAARMFAASLAENDGDIDAMREQTELALADFRVLGERWGLTGVLRSAGYLCALDGDLDGAVAAYTEALQLAEELASREDEGFLRGRLAEVALRRDDVAEARRHLDRAAASAQERGSTIEAVLTLAMRSRVEEAAGDELAARQCLDEAARRMAGLPPPHPAQGHIRAFVLAVGARRAAADGDAAGGALLLAQAWDAAHGAQDMPLIATIAVAAASIDVAAGDAERAAQLLGVAARLRGADDPTARDVRDVREQLRAALGPHRLSEGYENAKALARASALAVLAERCRRV